MKNKKSLLAFIRFFALAALLISWAACSTSSEYPAAMRRDSVALSSLSPAQLSAVQRSSLAAAELRHVAAGDFQLERIDDVTWPNTALGLPRPGMVYAQMLVPGHQVVLRLPNGARTVCHTSATNVFVAQ